jgi:hypothetical protein
LGFRKFQKTFHFWGKSKVAPDVLISTQDKLFFNIYVFFNKSNKSLKSPHIPSLGIPSFTVSRDK